MYVKKIIGFCQLLKKMHTKENSFFQPHGVYNSRPHQRGQTSANEWYTSGVLSEMTRDVGGDASCQRQRQHQKPNEPHANHTRYVRLHTQTHTLAWSVYLSVCHKPHANHIHYVRLHTDTHTCVVCLSVTNLMTITHVMYTYTQTHTLAQSVCLSQTS